MAYRQRTIFYVLICVVIVGFTVLFQHKNAVGVYEVMRKAHLQQAHESIVLEKVCGSPAVDGYAHVDPECLSKSPTNTAYSQFLNESVRVGHGPPIWRAVILNNSDVDGLAVGWGIGNKKNSAKDCESACVKHLPEWLGGVSGGPFSQLPCNAWAWCPDEVCWEPDAHHHTKGKGLPSVVQAPAVRCMLEFFLVSSECWLDVRRYCNPAAIYTRVIKTPVKP